MRRGYLVVSQIAGGVLGGVAGRERAAFLELRDVGAGHPVR
jgi:hypothetical protein